jgi:hypothetical protein
VNPPHATVPPAGDVPYPDRLVLGARHKNAIGRVQGDAPDAGAMRAHLNTQYWLRCLGPERFPCGQQGDKGVNQPNGKDISELDHGVPLFAQGLTRSSFREERIFDLICNENFLFEDGV